MSKNLSLSLLDTVNSIFEGIALEDREYLYKTLKRFPNDFVHFSNSEMVSFNPNPDIAIAGVGIYAYPIEDVLKAIEQSQSSIIKLPKTEIGYDREIHMKVYREDSKFFHVLRVNLENVISLENMTVKEALKIIKDNNWGERFSSVFSGYDDNGKTGELFWSTLERAANINNSVNKLLKVGVNGVYDDIGWVIAADIYRELVLYTPKAYKVIFTGINKHDTWKNTIRIISNVMDKIGAKKIYIHGSSRDRFPKFEAEYVLNSGSDKIVFYTKIPRYVRSENIFTIEPFVIKQNDSERSEDLKMYYLEVKMSGTAKDTEKCVIKALNHFIKFGEYDKKIVFKVGDAQVWIHINNFKRPLHI